MVNVYPRLALNSRQFCCGLLDGITDGNHHALLQKIG